MCQKGFCASLRVGVLRDLVSIWGSGFGSGSTVFGLRLCRVFKSVMLSGYPV